MRSGLELEVCWMQAQTGTERGMKIGRKLKLLLYPYVIKEQGLKRATLQACLPLFSVL